MLVFVIIENVSKDRNVKSLTPSWFTILFTYCMSPNKALALLWKGRMKKIRFLEFHLNAICTHLG